MQVEILSPQMPQTPQAKEASQTQNPKTILFFSGFSGERRVFEHLRLGACEVVFVSDYRANDLDLSFLDSREEITLIAWSMGVAMANRFLNQSRLNHSVSPTRLKITKKIAINGTIYGIDKARGIPPLAFKKTIEGLDLQAFKKSTYGENEPCTTLSQETLVCELNNLYTTLTTTPATPELWDCALVSLEDRIFPARYQLRGWEGHAKRIIHTHAPHFAFGVFESWRDLCEMESACDLC